MPRNQRTTFYSLNFTLVLEASCTTSVIQTNRLWEDLGKSLESPGSLNSWSKVHFQILRTCRTVSSTHLCMCVTPSRVKSNTYGDTDRMNRHERTFLQCSQHLFWGKKETGLCWFMQPISCFLNGSWCLSWWQCLWTLSTFSSPLTPLHSGCIYLPHVFIWRVFYSWESSMGSCRGLSVSVVNVWKMGETFPGKPWNYDKERPRESSWSCTGTWTLEGLDGNSEMWGHPGGNVRLFSKLV